MTMKKTDSIWTTLLIGLVTLFGAVAALAETPTEEEPLIFGVVPQQAAAKLASQWVPMVRYLEKETGRKVVFRTARDIPTFEQRLLDGEYDFAYMNPYHYIALNQQRGYQAIARASDKKLCGIMVVRKDASIETLEALNGDALAFPSPGAFAASMITRAELQQRGIAFTPKYVSSHDSVYRTVAAGLYPAGGGVMRTFNTLDKNVRDQLKILWTSPGSTPHAIAHHPRVEPGVVAAVKKALLDMESDADGSAILNDLQVKGFTGARDSDWDDVRALNIASPIGLHP
jgi:phosphonate transport system substrate-binding protein